MSGSEQSEDSLKLWLLVSIDSMSETSSESRLRYVCVNCGRVFEKDMLSRISDTRCPVCGYNVMRKAKSPTAKLIKTSEIGKEPIRPLG